MKPVNMIKYTNTPNAIHLNITNRYLTTISANTIQTTTIIHITEIN